MVNRIEIEAVLNDQVSSGLQKIQGHLQGLGKQDAAKAILTGVGISTGITAYDALEGAVEHVVAAGEDAIKVANEQQVAQTQLNTSLKDNVANYNIYNDTIAEAIDKGEKLGFGNIEQEKSLASLLLVTHDVNKALALQSLGMDVARLKGRSLGDATKLLTRVYAGHVDALAKFGIALKDIKSPTEALQMLQRSAAGQADAYAQTYEGAGSRLDASIENLQEKLGALVEGPMTDFVGQAAEDVRSLEDFAKTVDDAIPGLNTLHINIADVFMSFPDIIGNAIGSFQHMQHALQGIDDTQQQVAGSWDHGTAELSAYDDALASGNSTINDNISTMKVQIATLKDAADAEDNWKSAILEASGVINQHKRGHQELRLQLQGTNLDMKDVNKQIKDLAGKKPTLAHQEELNQLRLQLLTDKDKAGDLHAQLQTMGKVSAKVTSDWITTLGKNADTTDAKVRNLISDLNRLGLGANAVGGGEGTHSGHVQNRAAGGAVWGGRSYIVGEEREEMLTMFPGGGGYVTPSPHGGGGRGGGVHLHVHSIWPPSPQQVGAMADELERYSYFHGFGASGNRT